jgi:hypothetical protein
VQSGSCGTCCRRLDLNVEVAQGAVASWRRWQLRDARRRLQGLCRKRARGCCWRCRRGCGYRRAHSWSCSCRSKVCCCLWHKGQRSRCLWHTWQRGCCLWHKRQRGRRLWHERQLHCRFRHTRQSCRRSGHKGQLHRRDVCRRLRHKLKPLLLQVLRRPSIPCRLWHTLRQLWPRRRTGVGHKL